MYFVNVTFVKDVCGKDPRMYVVKIVIIFTIYRPVTHSYQTDL